MLMLIRWFDDSTEKENKPGKVCERARERKRARERAWACMSSIWTIIGKWLCSVTLIKMYTRARSFAQISARVQSNLLFVHSYVGACCQKENETCFCRILDFSQRCFTSFLVDFNFTLMPFASQAAFRQSTNNVMGSLLFHFFRFHM